MTETVRVLTVRERLVSVAAVSVLAAGSLGAAAVEPDPSTTAATAGVSSAASPAASPAAASPSPVPAPAPPPPPAPKAEPAGPIPAPEEKPQAGCPVPKRPSSGKPWVPKPLPKPVVAESALPKPVATAGQKARDLATVSGKGVWVTNFAQTPVDPPALVARAKAAGLTNIWIRTGGKQGYYGHQFLPELVPLAHAEGIAVIAWDFPYLSDPVADADRARRAFADGVDAFAPDIETSAEGTHATAARVTLYLSLVRAYAGDRPIAATVPRPTPLRRTSFPYKAFVPYADLFAPMVYWSCHEPGTLVIQSLHELGAMLPVAPVGQAYDMGEEGGRAGTPTREETWRFLDVARRGGAVGASLWTIERMGQGQYDALRDYPWSPQG